MKMIRGAVTVVVAGLLVAACDGSGTNVIGSDTASAIPAEATGSIVTTAVQAGQFNTLAEALTVTGLDTVLADESRKFTVFAPTDAAFAALGQETIDGLLADPVTLSNILLYHVVPDQNVSSEVATSLVGTSVQAANEQDLQITSTDGALFINESRVIVADVAATNGTIHAIDNVLLPTATMDTDPSDNVDEAVSGNLVETALAAGNFNTLAAALEATDLVSTLADEEGVFTVFAPTDDAFAALGEGAVADLLADPDTLRDILLYHVVSGAAVDAATAIDLAGTPVGMANGDSTAVSLDDGSLFINQSQVVATDVLASNGIIHVIDSVLLPPQDQPEEPVELSIYDTAIAAGSFNTLITALQAIGLDNVLAGNGKVYTVFAPTDEAFAALGQETINQLLADTETLTDILLYHVIAEAEVDAATAISLAGGTAAMANGGEVALSLDGGELFVNMSKVTATDINASNGIIHVIDKVLVPGEEDNSAALSNIVDTAVAAGSFTTLVAALQATDLDHVLADESQVFTVFAPTDDAFNALGAETINQLLADPETLSDILLYHVVSDTAIDAETAAGLSGTSVTMANGDSAAISLHGKFLSIENALVTITDIETSNGIIHVIDTVLSPH